MKKAINLQELINSKEEEEKPIEFTGIFNDDCDWSLTSSKPNQYDNVVYRGVINDEHIFWAFNDEDEWVDVYKGHYNSGKY